MPAPPTPPLALHVTLHWRGDAIAFRRLRGHGAAAVGAHPDALAPIPCPAALAGGFVFARVGGAAATALVPDGSMASVRRAGGLVEVFEGPTSVALDAGDSAELAFGAFRLTAAADVPEALPRRRRQVAGAWAALAAAALAHAVVLGLAAHDAHASSATDDDDDERTRALIGLLASAELRERANATPLEDARGTGEGSKSNDRHGDGRLGGGERALGEEGALGDRLAHAGSPGHFAVPEQIRKDPEPSTSRAEALADAEQFGMIGLLAQGPQVPAAAFADPWAHGADALAANGSMWARQPGESFGAYGLGLTGIGEGGGGRGEGIGLGTVGTLGHTYGHAGPGLGGEGSRGPRGGHKVKWARYFCGGDMVSGRLPPEIVQRIVRQNFGRIRGCYEKGLAINPNIQGRVTVRFVIGHDGAVSNVADGGSDLPDVGVIGCIVRAFQGISFPQPDGGIVTVNYPIVLSPE